VDILIFAGQVHCLPLDVPLEAAGGAGSIAAATVGVLGAGAPGDGALGLALAVARVASVAARDGTDTLLTVGEGDGVDDIELVHASEAPGETAERALEEAGVGKLDIVDDVELILAPDRSGGGGRNEDGLRYDLGGCRLGAKELIDREVGHQALISVDLLVNFLVVMAGLEVALLLGARSASAAATTGGGQHRERLEAGGVTSAGRNGAATGAGRNAAKAGAKEAGNANLLDLVSDLGIDVLVVFNALVHVVAPGASASATALSAAATTAASTATSVVAALALVASLLAMVVLVAVAAAAVVTVAVAQVVVVLLMVVVAIAAVAVVALDDDAVGNRSVAEKLSAGGILSDGRRREDGGRVRDNALGSGIGEDSEGDNSEDKGVVDLHLHPECWLFLLNC